MPKLMHKRNILIIFNILLFVFLFSRRRVRGWKPEIGWGRLESLGGRQRAERGRELKKKKSFGLTVRGRNLEGG